MDVEELANPREAHFKWWISSCNPESAVINGINNQL